MNFIAENWEFRKDIREVEKNRVNLFEVERNSWNEQILRLMEDNFIFNNVKNKKTATLSNDEELKLLIDENKELRQEIEYKLKDLSKNQDQYETYKKDQKLLTQEVRERHEAFLTAKKYYKKFLKIYFTIESRSKDTQTVYVQFFTESKKEPDYYSVRLVRNIKTGNYDLQSANPKLKNFKELQKRLLDTNDVPGVLCYIRQAFLKMKSIKK
ncbi:uncharacterized protein LOC121732583 [Aricia agestis]|uniref:uncharacterized protein LOC121732583 n=1 Tax=Aricia agestis TaxID=91739 RepID=UPI001C2070BF|nr:uncharacterized protein LOC121732583 [Aricia agestis]